MLKIKFLFLINCLFLIHTYAQEREGLEVSLLTCSSGQEIYATFGHTAIRIRDAAEQEDLVFDFGTFRFDTPFFAWRFLKGDLEYSLSVRKFDKFIRAYKIEGREVIEEKLNIPAAQKQLIYQRLIENYRPENRYYKYDFLFDNCTTRVRDLLFQMPIEALDTNQVTTASFRENLGLYLTDKKWLQLGIDLLLGASVDKRMTSYEQMFLPNQLSHNLQAINATASRKFLYPPKTLLSQPLPKQTSYPYFSPVVIFFVLIGILLFFAFWKPTSTEKILWWFYFIFGLVGLFLLFMWFGTTHETSKMNWNILWANPLYLFLLPKKRITNSLYIKLVLVWNILLLIIWTILPQVLNMAIIPLVCGFILLNSISMARHYNSW